MKLNFLMYDILRTGGNRILLEYADLLSKNGHDVIIYKILKPEIQKKNYSIKNIKEAFVNKFYSLIDNKKNLLMYGNFGIKIKFIITINNYFVRDADATIISYWPFAFSLNKLNKTKGKKIYLIQAYENWNCDIELLHRTYILPLIKITVSNNLRLLVKNISKQDSHVILNGIDFNKFYNENKTFSYDKLVISYIHYESEFKGSKYALEAICKLKKKYPEILFNSFGYAKPHNLPDFINFYEKPDDNLIRKLYSEADIFICTSLIEGFYLVPAEAMACKCAVLTTPVGAVTEYSSNNESAIFIEPENSMDIYEKIVELKNFRDNLKRISINGYDSVSKKLNWSKSLFEFEQILKS